MGRRPRRPRRNRGAGPCSHSGRITPMSTDGAAPGAAALSVLSVLLAGQCPELLAETQVVPTIKARDEHAVLEVIEAHPGNADLSSRGGDAEELACLRPCQRPA